MQNENTESNLGLFAAVTGGLKRSFSSSVGKKRPSSSALGSTVAAQQFVFTSAPAEDSSHFSTNFTSAHEPSSSAFARDGGHSNFGSSSAAGSSSLFAKLGGGQLLKKAKSVGPFGK